MKLKINLICLFFEKINLIDNLIAVPRVGWDIGQYLSDDGQPCDAVWTVVTVTGQAGPHVVTNHISDRG